MDTIIDTSLNAFPNGKTGLVYVLKYDGLYKIGYSIDIRARKRTLQMSDAELVYSIESNNAPALEHSLHAKFVDKRVHNSRCSSGNSEWFKLDDADLDFIKCNYVTSNKTRAVFTPKHDIPARGIHLTCLLDKKGRIRIPPHIRDKFGFNGGDVLSVVINTINLPEGKA